jgi:hypothetical protein
LDGILSYTYHTSSSEINLTPKGRHVTCFRISLPRSLPTQNFQIKNLQHLSLAKKKYPTTRIDKEGFNNEEKQPKRNLNLATIFDLGRFRCELA